jgi:hypothetical protein
VLSSLLGLDLAQDLFSCLGLFLAAARVNLFCPVVFPAQALNRWVAKSLFFPSASGQCLLVLPAVFAFPPCCFLNVISCALILICVGVFAIQVLGVRNPSLCLLLFLMTRPDSAISSSGSAFGLLISFPMHLICNQAPVLSLLHGHRVLDGLPVGIKFLLPELRPDFLSAEECAPD